MSLAACDVACTRVSVPTGGGTMGRETTDLKPEGVCHGYTFLSHRLVQSCTATTGARWLSRAGSRARAPGIDRIAVKPTMVTRMTLAVMISIAAVGVLAAGLEDDWDLAVVFVVLGVLAVVLLARTSTRRPLVPIRADLVRWMSARAAVDGDRTERLADRAIAAYRDGLAGREDDPSGGTDR